MSGQSITQTVLFEEKGKKSILLVIYAFHIYRLIRRRLGASDSDSVLSIPRLMIIHQMPRLHQGDEDVSSEDDDFGRDDLLFNR